MRLLHALVGLGTSALAAVARPPHIVYFLVDDLGNANVGFRNDEPITPAIDTLAAGGAVLDRFYVFRFCSPTRSSFLSGRLPYHVNQANHPPNVPGGGVPPEMATIADCLNRADPPYRSHQIGKWHGGMSRPEQLPVRRGFASSLGYLSGAEDHFNQQRDGYADFWRDERPAVNETGLSEKQCINATGITADGCRYATYQYAAEAQRIIGAHPTPGTTPLFLYLAFGNMHGPLQAPQKWLDLYPNITYRPRRSALAQISIVDEAIANVTAALKARPGMYENTLLIFSSDNGGPADHANNYPYRGAKGCDLEGGVRAVAFLAGGALPAAQRGTTVKGMLHIADLYATFAALAGVDPADTQCAASGTGGGGAIPCPPIDSLDMWPMLSGANATSPRTELMLNSNGNVSSSDSSNGNDGNGMGFAGTALIGEGGRFKLVRGQQLGFFPGPHMPNSSDTGSGVQLDCRGGGPGGPGGPSGPGACLFDLLADPTEHFDLGADPAYAAVVARLQARAAALDATQFQSEGGADLKADPAATAQAKANGGFWGPWQQDTPFPTPAPTPAPPPTAPPAPAPPVAGQFELRWQGAAAACLAPAKLEKASTVGLGDCASGHSGWITDADSCVLSAGMQGKGAADAYLRQSPGGGNCTAGNTAQLGIDGRGGLTTVYDAINSRLVLSACDGLCIGVLNKRVELVPCTDTGNVQHWTKV